MRSLALVYGVLLAAVLSASSAQPTRPPTAPPEQKPAPTPEQKPAPTPEKPAGAPVKADAEIVSAPLKGDASSNATVNRYLIVAGRGEYTIWANLAQIFVAVEPRVIQSAIAGNQTGAQGQGQDQKYLPDEKAKSEIKKVYERVIGVLENFKAANISSPPAFVSSPMFEPNITAFKMVLAHRAQMMDRRRKALAQRVGNHVLLQGSPLSMHNKAFVPRHGLMHRSTIRNANAPIDDGIDSAAEQHLQQQNATQTPSKPAEATKDVKADDKAKNASAAAPAAPAAAAPKPEGGAKEAITKEQKPDQAMVPLPDPKSMIIFKGFRFYRPLSAVVPIELVPEIAQSLGAVNATIESVQLALSPKAFDEARIVATKAAIERALTVADAALSAAGEKRVKLNTVLINSSNEPRLPRLPMFRAAFLRPQPVPVVSQVILRVTF